MNRQGFLAREPVALLFLGVMAALTTSVGVASGQPLVLLIGNALPPYLVFLDRLRHERRASAFALMVAWAVMQSVCIIAMTRAHPAQAAQTIYHGAPYREEMFRWIRTGEGAEGNWRLFLPQHALHYGVFMLLSAMTAGAGGLILGVFLLNYMSFYVGSLFVADAGQAHFTSIALMGFPVWAMIRVVGFIAGAVAMAELTLAVIGRLRDRPFHWPGRSSYYLSLSLALVILDALLKALLASHWRVPLLPALTR